jgi:transposase
MVDINRFDIQTERVDDIPLVYNSLQKMGIQAIVDSIISPHGNWQGLTIGWVITIWLTHILVRHTHRMDCVQEWVAKHLLTLGHLTGQPVTPLDFTDDRLALCLRYLQPQSAWVEVESRLGNRLVQVYDLAQKLPERWCARLDSTVGVVNHDPNGSSLFQVGKAKNGLFETLYKMMLGSLDPLGLPLAVDVVPGNRADDPLYLPVYRRIKKTFPGRALLVVGDSKMSALPTRATIANSSDQYLTPLAYLKDEPKLLDELLAGQRLQEAQMPLIFLDAALPADGTAPNPADAVARGFEVSRSRSAIVNGRSFTWQERLLVVRSFSYMQSEQAALQKRLDKAEAALRALTPPRQRGKKQMEDEKTLLTAIKRLEKQYKVSGLFTCTAKREVEERPIRAHKGKPARVEKKVRYQLTVQRDQAAIAAAMFKMGWRIYATNAPALDLSLSQAVQAYRSQYVAENIFRRLQGKLLSITPVYVQRDDHAEGLFHLLTIAARALALGDYVAKEALAEVKEELTGIFPGNPKRSTATPTMERMLQVFEDINLTILRLGEQVLYQLTPLTGVQERILGLLGIPLTAYTGLAPLQSA